MRKRDSQRRTRAPSAEAPGSANRGLRIGLAAIAVVKLATHLLKNSRYDPHDSFFSWLPEERMRRQ